MLINLLCHTKLITSCKVSHLCILISLIIIISAPAVAGSSFFIKHILNVEIKVTCTVERIGAISFCVTQNAYPCTSSTRLSIEDRMWSQLITNSSI